MTKSGAHLYQISKPLDNVEPGGTQKGSPKRVPSDKSTEWVPTEATQTAGLKGTVKKKKISPSEYNAIPLKVAASEAQKKVLDYLASVGPHFNSVPNIARVLGLNEKAVRRAINKFHELDVVIKEYDASNPTGLRLIPQTEVLRQLSLPRVPTSGQIDSSSFYTSLSKIPLSEITSSEFRTQYPALYDIGFGSDQVRQIVRGRLKHGDPIEDLTESLAHADWELAKNGFLRMANGLPADKSPCGFLYKHLVKVGGYWPAPEGYMSPRKRAHLDKQKQLREELEALKKLERVEYELWVAKLSDGEKAELRLEVVRQQQVAGNPGVTVEYLGPIDQWLLPFWREKIKKSSADQGDA